MLKLLPSGGSKFHNFKCGEIYCETPTSYYASCSLCGKRLLFEDFSDHFQKEHLSHEDSERWRTLNALKDQNKDENRLQPLDVSSTAIKSEHDIEFESIPSVMAQLDDEKPIDLIEVQLSEQDEDRKNIIILGNLTMESVVGLDDTNSEINDGDIFEQHDGLNFTDDDSKDSTESVPAKKIKRNAISCTLCIRTYKSKRALYNHLRVNHNQGRKVRSQPKEKTDARDDSNVSVEGNSVPDETVLDTVDKDSDDMNFDGDPDDDDSDYEDKEAKKEDEKIPCKLCDRTYKSKRAMYNHVRKYHKNKKQPVPKPYKCEECGEAFRTEQLLNSHKLKHTGIFCDICGMKFTQAGNMKRHKIRHTGIKAFKCEECGNDFFTDKELKAHMMRHTGIWPIVCEICGRRCRDHGVLTAHMRRHTGERPAKCEVCGKCFYSVYDLNVHGVTHSSARPFHCDVCSSTFQTKKALRVHKKLHSTDRRHECKICGKCFVQSGGLYSHMKTHDGAEGL